MLTPHRTSLVGLICAFAMVVTLSACGDDGACEVDQDCPVGEVCEGGLCQPEIQSNQDDNQNDEDQNNDDQNNDDQNNDDQNNDDQNDNDENTDPGNPEVVDVEPEDGSTDVSVDTEIRVTFDRALDQATLSDDSLQVRTPSATPIDGDVDYSDDNDEYVVTFTPDEQLWEGTRYSVHATTEIKAQGSLMPLAEEQTTWFITDWAPDDEATELAEEYAPVIHQDTKNTDQPAVHLDIPTSVAFDGNYDANDNLGAAQQSDAEVPAQVYYSVKTTESHHFIQYVLYYTGRAYDVAFDDSTFEHDFTGLAMIVERQSGDVVFVDGVDAGETSTDDSRLQYAPYGSPVTTQASDDNHQPQQFSSQGLEDGTSFMMYIPSGTHSPCYWYERGEQEGWTVDPCLGTDEEFDSGDGVVLRAGDEAQTYDEADDEETDHLEMTYALQSFTDPFWLRRGDFSCGLFNTPGFTYDPDADRPDGPGADAAHMPRSLCSDDSTSYGTLPFRWLRSSATDASGGVWFMDPAFYLNALYDFGEDFSDEYCYHPHFNIDRRDDLACRADECDTYEDCEDNEVCDTDADPNVCIPECTDHTDCGDGEVCDTDDDPNFCVPECTDNDDCADDEVCVTDDDPNVCVDEDQVDECTEATEEDDCADGEVCDTDEDPNVCVDDDNGDNGDNGGSGDGDDEGDEDDEEDDNDPQ